MKRLFSSITIFIVGYVLFISHSPVSAVSGWPECDYGSQSFNLNQCRAHAEQFKDKIGPRGDSDESWYTWATSAPYPLSLDTACGIAPQSLDCRPTPTKKKSNNGVPSCPSNTKLLFNKGGHIHKGDSMLNVGDITSIRGDWEIEKEDSLLMAVSHSEKPHLEITFDQQVLIKSALIFDNDPEEHEHTWTINGIGLPTTHDDGWGAPYELNMKTKKMVFDSNRDTKNVHFNLCVGVDGVNPTTTVSPTSGSHSPTPSIPTGGNGVSLKFDPTTLEGKVGDTFTVRVLVDTYNEESFGSEAHVEYDKNVVNLANIQEGDFFPSVISTNNTGNSSIRGLVVEPADFRKGTGLLATLQFNALADGETDVIFFCQPGVYNSSKIVKNDINASNIIDCSANNSLHIKVGAGGTTISPTGSNTSKTPTPTPKISKDRAKVLAAIIVLIFILLIILMGI